MINNKIILFGVTLSLLIILQPYTYANAKIETNDILNGAITNPKIANNSVNSTQIQPGVIPPSIGFTITYHSIHSNNGVAGLLGNAGGGFNGWVTGNITASSDIHPDSILILSITLDSNNPISSGFPTCMAENPYNGGFFLTCNGILNAPNTLNYIVITPR